MPYKKKEDYNRYMRNYQKELRQLERQVIRDARAAGLDTRIRSKKRRKKRR